MKTSSIVKSGKLFMKTYATNTTSLDSNLFKNSQCTASRLASSPKDLLSRTKGNPKNQNDCFKDPVQHSIRAPRAIDAG